MALTPEEQVRLDYINERLAEIEDAKKGQQHVDTFKTSTASQEPPTDADKVHDTRPFSLKRVVLGGLLRDPINNLLTLGSDLDEALNMPSLAFGSAADNGIIGFNTAAERRAKGLHEVTLPNLKGSESAGTPENLIRGLVGFAVPFTAALKATSGLRALPLLGRAAEGAEAGREFTLAGRVIHSVAAGSLAAFQQEDPVGNNLANILKDSFGLDNAMIDSLAAEEDDSVLMTRLKAAAADVPLGLAGEAIFEAGAKGLRAYRAWKGTMAENVALVESHTKGPVSLLDAHAPADTAATRTLRVKGLQGKVGTVEIDPSTFTTMDDVLGFLRQKAGAIEMDPDNLQRFAANLIEGEPENALAKLGIDPAKLDFSVYRDPEALGRLQRGLAEVYEGLAEKLGRSNVRVTERELVRGAEALASTPEVLRSLYGSTRGLAEKLMAGRMIVGGHAHKLLATAKEALQEIENGPPGEAWGRFLEAFHDHAYLMGAVRGAGSEVGRALRSLQTIVKVNAKRAEKVLKEADKADVAEGDKALAKNLTVAEGADEYAKLLTTDAEKVKALKKLIDLEGDVAELSRTVREGHTGGLHRFSEALMETMGSLFTSITGTANTVSSLGFMGLNALGRYAAAAVRSTMGLVSARQALEARRATLEAWAITEGIIGGFRPAISATLGVLKRELLSEASINLDGLGFENLAKKSVIGSAKAERQIGEHFERSDVVSHKAFSMSGAERQRFEQAVDELDGPKFFKAGLKGLIRLSAATVNAAGSGFRSGTTLFINLPDEFAGTIATRAGAYQSAVRLSAKEATHLGLEGKEFSEFVKARSQVLFGEGPRGWAEDGELAGLRHVMQRAGTEEAKMVLFQDDLQWKFNRWIAQGHRMGGGFSTLIVPFIKTPLRILERTTVDFTPLGLVSKRLQKAIAAGGSQRDEALARMSLGMMAMITAYHLAEDRTIVGMDGGYLSTARDAGRDSYSLKVGDDVYEFKRYDPIGTLLGFSADLRNYLEQTADDPDAANRAVEMFKGMFYAITTNVLSKTWLTSIKQLTDLAGATNGEDVDLRVQKFLKGLSSRAVPASGVQRMVSGWGDGYLREATNFSEGIWQNSIGASALPLKRDFLGRPISQSDSERMVGLPGDIMPFGAEDPVMAEMERLSFRKPTGARKQKGVKLNAAQFSRFLELRGQVVKDTSGLTMEQALKALVTAPEYQSLPSDAAKEAAIRSLTKNYSSLAADALTREDESYAQARLKNYIYTQSHLRGWTPDQRDQVLSEQSHALSAWLQHQQQ